MQQNNGILNELREWNSPLATVPRDMPFTVPDGFFEQFSSEITVLTAGSALPAIEFVASKAMPFNVPENYFDSFPDHILSLVREEIPVAGSLPGVSFDIPGGYFQSFPEKILALAKTEDESAYALQHVSKEMSFAVPAGYFEELPGKIAALAQKQHTQKSRVIALKHFPTWKSIRLTVAAILILGFGFSIYNYMQSGKISGEASTAAQLKQLPESLISDYIQSNIDDFDSDMIEHHLLASNPQLPAEPGVNKLNKNDIIQYLNETGWDENDVSVN